MAADQPQMTAPQAREGQTFGGASRRTAYVNLVKLPHPVFALPFSLGWLVLGCYRRPKYLTEVGWVLLRFSTARFAGMGFNRMVEREIDREMPRTSTRQIPRGGLSVTATSIAV